MGRELGRISGPLLADNLLRKGHNLAFETNLLYFDVVNNRIGINFGSPTTDLFVNGTTNTAYVNINQQAELANFTVFNNTIQNSHSTITIQPNQASDPTTVVPTLGTDNLNFNTNYIQNILASDSINITSTGTIKLNANTLVSGSLEVTGNITFDGNITLGDSNTDTVTFGAEVNSDIIPSEYNLVDELNNIFQTENDDTFLSESYYSLGSSTNNWLRLYTNTATTTLAQTTNLSNNNLTVGSLLIQNNTIYNTTLAQTVQFKPNGTGVVNLDNFVNFNTNTITNTSNGALIFASTSIPTATAFWRFNSASAMAIPVNDATNYTPEQGTIRFNPTTGDAEAYSTSNGWLNFIGPASSVVNQNQLQDETLVYTLMLGL
jgi:hypothetical protein